MPTLRVQLETASYEVIIEADALATAGERIRALAPHRRAVLAVDANVRSTHGTTVHDSLAAAGFEVTEIEIVADERRKSLETVRGMYERMLATRLERGSPVVAVGGGVTGDIAGFAAATFLRGVPLIQVPTTLLAMVDASIGGKTGVNIELPGDGGGLGKNLIGAFWQPRLVLADPMTLRTLDDRHLRCGVAECIKHGMIADAAHLTFIASNVGAILQRDAAVLERLIADSAAIKARIVEQDEREAGVRALLNLGHTFAHAIEPRPELGLQHGEAVAVGLTAATLVSELSRRIAPDEGRSLRDLLRLFDLPDRLAAPAPIDALVAAMRHDKKVRDDRLRLVLPTGIGSAEIFDDVEERLVREAWKAVGAR